MSKFGKPPTKLGKIKEDSQIVGADLDTEGDMTEIYMSRVTVSNDRRKRTRSNIDMKNFSVSQNN